jgi:hypothetical protein
MIIPDWMQVYCVDNDIDIYDRINQSLILIKGDKNFAVDFKNKVFQVQTGAKSTNWLPFISLQASVKSYFK